MGRNRQQRREQTANHMNTKGVRYIRVKSKRCEKKNASTKSTAEASNTPDQRAVTEG